MTTFTPPDYLPGAIISFFPDEAEDASGFGTWSPERARITGVFLTENGWRYRVSYFNDTEEALLSTAEMTYEGALYS